MQAQDDVASSQPGGLADELKGGRADHRQGLVLTAVIDNHISSFFIFLNLPYLFL
jgi:hypothetical protein